MKSLLVTENYQPIGGGADNIRVIYDKTTDLVWIDTPSLYEWVELGLPSGLKWAAWNVGAEKPEDFGLYFAWGETEGYTADDVNNGVKLFTWGDYKYGSGSTGATDTTFRGLTKYNNNSASGTVDNLTTLELMDDAAYQTDSTCRMPTSGECQELVDNTTSAWTDNYNESGVAGMIFTSKAEGNNNSIFVPAAGFCLDGSVNNVGTRCKLWCSTLDLPSYPNRGEYLDISSSSGAYLYSYYRYHGHTVRAVRDKKN